MAQGDHIYVKRFLYTHHGIDCGDGNVIHYTGTLWKRKGAEVQKTPLLAFTHGHPVYIRQYTPKADPQEVLKRAEERLGEVRYDLLFNNCEHFATWCITGIGQSAQVKKAFHTVAVLAATAIISGVATVILSRAIPKPDKTEN